MLRKEKHEDGKIPSFIVPSSPSLVVNLNYRTSYQKKKRKTKAAVTGAGTQKYHSNDVGSAGSTQCSPNYLINQLERSLSNTSTPKKKEVRRRLQKLLELTPATPPSTNRISSPLLKSATAQFTKSLEQACTPT